MDACLMPLCDRIKELDPTVTDTVIDGLLHGIRVPAGRRWMLNNWIMELKRVPSTETFSFLED